jgi:hypothetical protein
MFAILYPLSMFVLDLFKSSRRLQETGLQRMAGGANPVGLRALLQSLDWVVGLCGTSECQNDSNRGVKR